MKIYLSNEDYNAVDVTTKSNKNVYDLTMPKEESGVTTNGTFGAGIETAVKSFQSSKGPSADGKAGSTPMYELFN